MVRLIILVLIIIGGIWMFRACENDGEKVEFTQKEQNKERDEKQSSREAKESREEKTSKTEEKKDGEVSTLISKEDRERMENEILEDADGKGSDEDADSKSDEDQDTDSSGEDTDTNTEDEDGTGGSEDSDEDTDDKSWSQKFMDKITGGSDTDGETADAKGDTTSTKYVGNQTSVTGSTTPGSEATYGNVYTGNPSVPVTERKPRIVIPNRDSYLKVYVYENSIDTFGKPPTTGRIHFSVTNSGAWTQRVHIPGLGDLGKVAGGETILVSLNAANSGDYYIESYSAMGNAERHLPVVE